MRSNIPAGVALLAFAAGAAAQVTSINSVLVRERRFNDFPNTNLVTTNNYPAQVQFDESNFPTTPGGFANQHIASFSADGGNTKYQFQNNKPFNIKMDVSLEAGNRSPRKEAGFRFDSIIGGECFFFVTSDGEVAAFGGFFPFHSFGGNAYALGSTATLELIYRPATLPARSTLEYRFNGTSSGALEMTNNENGFIDGTVDGLYLQSQAARVPGEFSRATFSNFMVVPAPAGAAPFAFFLLAAGRRRR